MLHAAWVSRSATADDVIAPTDCVRPGQERQRQVRACWPATLLRGGVPPGLRPGRVRVSGAASADPHRVPWTRGVTSWRSFSLSWITLPIRPRPAGRTVRAGGVRARRAARRRAAACRLRLGWPRCCQSSAPIWVFRWSAAAGRATSTSTMRRAPQPCRGGRAGAAAVALLGERAPWGRVGLTGVHGAVRECPHGGGRLPRRPL